MRPAACSAVPLALTAGFLLLLAGATLAGQLPPAIPGLYGVASIAAFAAYALDKSAAKNNRWRIQESTLHLFALLGGWPGAVAAQRWLRHKSRKPSFQLVFRTTVALNCAALGWLVASADAAALRTLLGGA